MCAIYGRGTDLNIYTKEFAPKAWWYLLSLPAWPPTDPTIWRKPELPVIWIRSYLEGLCRPPPPLWIAPAWEQCTPAWLPTSWLCKLCHVLGKITLVASQGNKTLPGAGQLTGTHGRLGGPEHVRDFIPLPVFCGTFTLLMACSFSNWSWFYYPEGQRNKRRPHSWCSGKKSPETPWSVSTLFSLATAFPTRESHSVSARPPKGRGGWNGPLGTCPWLPAAGSWRHSKALVKLLALVYVRAPETDKRMPRCFHSTGIKQQLSWELGGKNLCNGRHRDRFHHCFDKPGTSN